MYGEQVAQSQQEAPVEFIFATHRIDNVGLMAEAARRHERVAIEFVGLAEETRQHMALQLGALTTSGLSEVERVDLEKELNSRAPDAAALTGIANHLRDTNKTFHLIDISEEHPDIGAVAAYIELDDEFQLYREQGMPSHYLRRQLARVLPASAESDIVRHSAINEQLAELAQQPTSLGAIVGATHTPAYHEYRKSHPASRSFAGGSSSGQRTQFSYDEDITRALVLKGTDRPINESMLNRALLERILDYYNPLDLATGSTYRERLIKDMSDSDVIEALSFIDRNVHYGGLATRNTLQVYFLVSNAGRHNSRKPFKIPGLDTE